MTFADICIMIAFAPMRMLPTAQHYLATLEGIQEPYAHIQDVSAFNQGAV